MLIRGGCESVERLCPCGVGRVGVVVEARVEDGVDDLFEVAFGDSGVAVAIGDHLALLRHAQSAADRPPRLGKDGTIGRAATPADRPAPAVGHLHRDPESAARLDEILLRLVEGPGRLEEAALLVAVGVADHHLLQSAAEFQVPAVDGEAEQPSHDR